MLGGWIIKMLKARIITALLLAVALVAATIFLSSFWFTFFISAIVLLAAWEWCGFIGFKKLRSKLIYMVALASIICTLYLFLEIMPSVESINGHRVSLILILGVFFWAWAPFILKDYPNNRSAWNSKSKIALMGFTALVPTWVGVIQLKYINPAGHLVLALIIMVAAADIGAYFVGKSFGKNKLAPNLSPNKTWEGVFGGLFACILTGLAFIWLFDNYLVRLNVLQISILVLLSLAVNFFDVVGDLLESMLKRNQNLKDSGSILPGHGGVLDRVDGLLAVTPIFVFTVLFID
tara:strand:- start:232 stop:1107 length:876 start_codon:yes stop_codon:yes gene_type:complete